MNILHFLISTNLFAICHVLLTSSRRSCPGINLAFGNGPPIRQNRTTTTPHHRELDCIRLSLVVLSFNNCTQIADRDLNWKIDRGQQKGQENIPTRHGRDKSTRSRSLSSDEVSQPCSSFYRRQSCTHHDEFVDSGSIASNVVCIQEKSAGQEPKGNDQTQKDYKKSNVGSQGANQEHEADEAHEQEPISDAGVEASRL